MSKTKRGSDATNKSNIICKRIESVEERCKLYFENSVSNYKGISEDFHIGATSQVRTEKEYNIVVAGVEWCRKYSGLRVEHEQYREPPDGITRALANDYAKKFEIVNDPDGQKVLKIYNDGLKLPRITKFYSIIKELHDCSNTKKTLTEVRNAGYAIPESYCKEFFELL